MVEGNFEILLPETLQIDSVLLLPDNHYFTTVEEFFWNLTFWNAWDWIIFTTFWEHYFTMVEENFEIWLPKTLQIWFNFTISWRMCKMLFHNFLQSAKNASLILYDFAPPTSLVKNLPPLCQKSTPPASLMTCPPPVFGSRQV